MSIADELREYAHDCCARIDDDIHAIADRIDAEHQKALDEWKAKNGQMWLKGYSECHAELLEGNETLASDLDRCGWIRLPKDADGEYVHVGDVMENVVCPSVHREVTGVGVECFYGWDEGNGRYSQFDVNSYRHHHAPTVEDVLREMLYKAHIYDEREMELLPDLIAEYAKRLTLRAEVDE